MTAADQIRALADTNTTDPWTTSECMPPWEHEGKTFPELVNLEPQVCSGVPVDDAAKIVAAVNALPHIADLIGVVDDEHRQFSESCVMCGGLWPCDYAAARDALVAALGVTP